MASNLCHISFTWDTDRSPSIVSKFTYLDVADLKLKESGNDTPTGYVTSEFGFGPETELWTKQVDSDKDSKHCTLQLTCPDPEFAQINGFVIISESRTLEVSSDTKGYLTTVRGKKLSEKLQKESLPTMFLCSCYFEESCSSLSVKFLSLGERSGFCVQAIRINIIQHGIHSSPTKGSLDVSKLKRDIEDMGSTMSDRAKDFMATLEQYEKNKLSSTNGLLSPRTSNSLMGANMNGISGIMSTILGTGTMKSLGGSGVGSDGDHQDIYKILNSVCGSISSRRVASAKQAEISCDATEDKESKVSTCAGVENGLVSNQSMDLITRLIAEKMEGLKSDLRDELSEVKQEVLSKVEDVRLELNGKLDLILNMLGNLESNKENT